MKKLVMVGAFLTVLSVNAFAQDGDESWTREMKQEFRKSCAGEMVNGGVVQDRAWEYCDCMADQIEHEFGLADFGYVTAFGSGEREFPEIKKRFEAAIEPCFE